MQKSEKKYFLGSPIFLYIVSGVHKRAVNFEVQKVQKPDLFDLAATSPRGDQGPLGHVSHTGANFTTKETPGAACVADNDQ